MIYWYVRIEMITSFRKMPNLVIRYFQRAVIVHAFQSDFCQSQNKTKNSSLQGQNEGIFTSVKQDWCHDFLSKASIVSFYSPPYNPLFHFSAKGFAPVKNYESSFWQTYEVNCSCDIHWNQTVLSTLKKRIYIRKDLKDRWITDEL